MLLCALAGRLELLVWICVSLHPCKSDAQANQHQFIMTTVHWWTKIKQSYFNNFAAYSYYTRAVYCTMVLRDKSRLSSDSSSKWYDITEQLWYCKNQIQIINESIHYCNDYKITKLCHLLQNWKSRCMFYECKRNTTLMYGMRRIRTSAISNTDKNQ